MSQQIASSVFCKQFSFQYSNNCATKHKEKSPVMILLSYIVPYPTPNATANHIVKTHMLAD